MPMCRDKRRLTVCVSLSVWACLRGQAWEALSRIATFPTAFIYRHLVAMLVFVFVFSFPVCFVASLGVSVIPASLVMCLTMAGVQQLALELDNPLGWDANDIDLDGIQTILVRELHTMYKYQFGVEYDDDVGDGAAVEAVTKQRTCWTEASDAGAVASDVTLLPTPESAVPTASGGTCSGGSGPGNGSATGTGTGTGGAAVGKVWSRLRGTVPAVGTTIPLAAASSKYAITADPGTSVELYRSMLDNEHGVCAWCHDPP